MNEFFDAFNAYAATHPDVLKLMHVLFWVRWWLFMAMIGVFLYLIFHSNQPMVALKKREDERVKARKDRFIA